MVKDQLGIKDRRLRRRRWGKIEKKASRVDPKYSKTNKTVLNGQSWNGNAIVVMRFAHFLITDTL